MAEIIANNQQKGKQEKRATNIDLTPMVDLGFLLITFFVFTTTRGMQTAMRVYLPADAKPPIESAESGSLTLMPDLDKVYFYIGSFEKALQAGQIRTAGFSGAKGIRQVILSLKHNLIKTNSNDDKLMVIIKPTDNCSFKHTVDLLDEMTINEVRRYALVDISKGELAVVK